MTHHYNHTYHIASISIIQSIIHIHTRACVYRKLKKYTIIPYSLNFWHLKEPRLHETVPIYIYIILVI